MLPQNDVDIYDGESIDGSFEAKNKNNWVQIFDMIDLTFNNLQQQNKELKRTVNELSSKVNKVRYFKSGALMKTFDFFVLQMVFHERKEESKNTEASKPKKATSDKPPEYNQSQVQASIFSHSIVNVQ